MQNTKKQLFAISAFLITVGLSTTAQAANNEDIKHLLATKKCQKCDLSNAGLVMADLSGADLSGANLAGANLSQAKLTGADLTGANLAGASLYGVNLISAKLNQANLTGTDLRNSYLNYVDLTHTNFKDANSQGANGIQVEVIKPEDFYARGVAQAEKGNLGPAINDFSQAIALKQDYAGAYLSRGIAYYQSLDRKDALQDAMIAARYFSMQGNKNGQATAKAFIQELTTIYTGEVKVPKPTFFDFFNSLGSVLLQFLPL
jgi:uncharacterized protein YjbI with pentapeptide repeats